MLPARAIACAIVLALLLPLVAASNHGNGGNSGTNNDCRSGRDATFSNPIRLTNGIWCEAHLPPQDWEDWFTFTANAGDTIEFSGVPHEVNVHFCIHWPSPSYNSACGAYLRFDADASGTWKVEAMNQGAYGPDRYELKVTVSPNAVPQAASIGCWPNPLAVGAVAHCQVRGADDDWIQWTIEWGDGTTTTTGWVEPGVLDLYHTWSAPGTYTLRARPTDEQGAVGNTVVGSLLVRLNAPPQAQNLACSPVKVAPQQTVTCSFRIVDDSDGVFGWIQWGDGSATRLPAAGTIRPGVTVSATHAYAAPGRYTALANATDNGGLVSAPLTSVVSVLLTRQDSGWILLGQPGTRVGRSLDEGSDRDRRIGWDSVWIPLVGNVHSVQLDWLGLGPSDLNVHFYKEDGTTRATAPTDLRCARVSVGIVEACDTPPEARWAMVAGTLGVDMDFTLTQWYS